MTAQKLWKWRVSWCANLGPDRTGRFDLAVTPVTATPSDDGTFYETEDQDDGRIGGAPVEPAGCRLPYRDAWAGAASSYREAAERGHAAVRALAKIMLEEVTAHIEKAAAEGPFDFCRSEKESLRHFEDSGLEAEGWRW